MLQGCMCIGQLAELHTQTAVISEVEPLTSYNEFHIRLHVRKGSYLAVDRLGCHRPPKDCGAHPLYC